MTQTDPQDIHPLDPLNSKEIERVKKTLDRWGAAPPRTRFVSITLVEPSKSAYRAWESGGISPPRLAKVVTIDLESEAAFEYRVSLDGDNDVERRLIEGSQPGFLREESHWAELAAKADPRWQHAMERRGFTDFEYAMLDNMPPGHQGPEQDSARRLSIALTWVRDPSLGEEDNAYARPVEGVIVHFDLYRREVIKVEDHDPIVPIPRGSGNYTPDLITAKSNTPYFPEGLRPSHKPIHISQPDGLNFELRGWHLRWDPWDLRLGFNIREGLTLHGVGYTSNGERRPIIYRLSLSEMFVPYGDPSPTHYRKQLFDEGESGIGRTANSLELGCDCLGEIVYLDGTVNDNDGNPRVINNAICIHEEDFNLLWKHTDSRSGVVESRRSRRLVVSSISTVGNYEYGFFYYFYLDGTIETEVKLTGILSTGAVDNKTDPTYGPLVAPGLYGPNHQHWFNYRIDLAVDGDINNAWEVNTAGVPHTDENPYGNAWIAVETQLTSEQGAMRDIDPMRGRYWKFTSGDNRNRVGKPTAYKLVPGENVGHFYQPDAPGLKRGAFIDHHLWITPFSESEFFAAGDYPNQHPGGAGLPEWTASDRSLEDQDLVAWYSFCAHHIPRPEDWPVMPIHRIGFQLKPNGFFDGNPAIDLARDPVAAHDRGGNCHCDNTCSCH